MMVNSFLNGNLSSVQKKIERLKWKEGDDQMECGKIQNAFHYGTQYRQFKKLLFSTSNSRHEF